MCPQDLRFPSGRRSSGFSLEEATSLRRMVMSHPDHVVCPACNSSIVPTMGGPADERIYLVRCPHCARSLLIQGAAEAPIG